MVVALRALDRDPEHPAAQRVHAVEHRLHAELFRVRAALLIDHRVAEKTRRHDLRLRGIRELIARELLYEKLVVRQVAVEGVDHPVAVKPDVARLVLFVAVAVRVARGVEPVAAPLFAVVRGGKQTLRLLRQRLGGGVGEKGIRLRNARRQAREIQRQPAQQRGLGRLWRRREIFLFQPREDERINRIPHPRRVFHQRQRGLHRRFESPVIAPVHQHHRRRVRPLRALIDPRPQQPDLLRREAFAFLRHHLIAQPGDEMNQQTLRAFPWHQRRPEFAAFHQHRRLVIEPEIRLLLFRPVAVVARRRKDRLDVAHEIHRPRRGRRELRQFRRVRARRRRRLQRQPVRPLRARIDPRPQQPHLRRRERVALALRRHLQILHQPRHIVNQRTPRTVALHDRLVLLPALQQPRPRIDAKVPLLLLRPVTLHARALQQRQNIPRKIRPTRRRRQLLHIHLRPGRPRQRERERGEERAAESWRGHLEIKTRDNALVRPP